MPEGSPVPTLFDQVQDTTEATNGRQPVGNDGGS
jgi:hypothetical protein